jgi:3-oxo-5alpha-steroid 4-dehydrogenase
VLAGGSFAYNADMIARHVPVLSGRPGSAIEQHDGQGIRAAQALGADGAHLDACEVAVLADPGLMIHGIVVNGRGEGHQRGHLPRADRPRPADPARRPGLRAG